ncbi:MAG TPA: GAF domain-containing protein [Candidatus Acidoferrum sp.]|nr:GAF domain-containing protein [Candidatus Acidoferrum sp.]
MIGTENGSRPPAKTAHQFEPADNVSAIPSGTEELRLRVQQLSLREQIERNHFLLMRLNAANARLIQSLENNDVFEAIAEIIANLVGSEEIAVFDFHPAEQNFSLAWSSGVEAAALQPFFCGAGMFGRVVQQGVSQYRERQPEAALLPYEKSLTACVILKSSGEIVGVIAIFGLLPQKSILEWADFELLKFLETYGAVAIKFQRLQGKQVSP